jgi:uracil-DNA glycosylase
MGGYLPVQVKPDGPCPAKIMIVGEAPGANEEILGRPFCGASGIVLAKMLAEAGIKSGDVYYEPKINENSVRWLGSECFMTNIARIRPPSNDIQAYFAKSKKAITAAHKQVRDKWVTKEVVEGLDLLRMELTTVKPNIVVAVGNTPLWALTGRWGITKWRGSMLYSDLSGVAPVKVLPSYHPAAILRQWDWRAVGVNDLRRAARFKDGQPYPKPDWKFTIRPDYRSVMDCLEQLYIRANHAQPLRISFDLETRAGHIACIGLAWSLTEAICIPLLVGGLNSAWSEIQEAEILWRIYRLLTHPNVRIIGQNLLYDCQYTWKWLRFVPNVEFDTMIGQHACFSALPKGLGFLASMYCNYYVYWKDEGKNI